MVEKVFFRRMSCTIIFIFSVVGLWMNKNLCVENNFPLEIKVKISNWPMWFHVNTYELFLPVKTDCNEGYRIIKYRYITTSHFLLRQWLNFLMFHQKSRTSRQLNQFKSVSLHQVFFRLCLRNIKLTYRHSRYRYPRTPRDIRI